MFGEGPTETTADVVQVLADCYNLKALRVTELVSFDSRNFAVEVLPMAQNKDDLDEAFAPENVIDLLEERAKCKESSVKLVLKIFNSDLCTAERLPMTKQQIVCSQFLRQQGFRCPQVVHTCWGELFGYTALQGQTLLMEMLEGQQLGADQSKISSRVLFEVGALLACMHQTLQGADAQHMEPDPTNPWVQENLHLLVDYLHCIQDDDERLVLKGILTRFQQIRHKFPTLKKGIIHGDFHDFNLIVDWEALDATSSPPSPPSEHSKPHPPSLQDFQCKAILKKYGIIDFEEMSLSYPALELGQLLADMMIDCHQVSLLDIGGHVLAGYISVDSTVLKQCGEFLYDVVLACLAQVVVLSTYEYQAQGQSNEYHLLSRDDARAVLSKLRTVDVREVHSAWGNVLSGYDLDHPFTI